MINILIIIILVIIIFLASIMIIPFHITLNLGNKDMEVMGYFKVNWMRIRILRREIPLQRGKKGREKGKRKKKK